MKTSDQRPEQPSINNNTRSNYRLKSAFDMRSELFPGLQAKEVDETQC